MGGKVLSVTKEGYRYYNANDELIKEVSDKALSKEEVSRFVKSCQGAYLFAMDKKEETDKLYVYEMGIEFSDEQGAAADSYRVEVMFEKAVVEWDFYMNKVQR